MYRGAAHTCPDCHASFDVVAFPVDGETVDIDVCPRCGGCWLDFFDGEPIAVSGALVAHLGARHYEPVSHRADPACPGCGVPMQSRAYLAGPEVLRCGECASMFVRRDVLEWLSDATDLQAPESLAQRFARLLTWRND